MNTRNDEIFPPSGFEWAPGDLTKALGVAPGFIPVDRKLGDRMLRDTAREESWCSPLVIAGPFEVFDFTRGYNPNRELKCLFGLGRYDEDRRGMYETELFQGPEPRTVHVGLDIGAAEGTPIFSPYAAVVVGAEHLPAAGDYGGTVVLKLQSSLEIFVLFGHLSKATVCRWKSGDEVQRGELVGWLGGKSENGGWNPHLHWQFSWLRPLSVDLPGAVKPTDRALAVRIFSDPGLALEHAVGGTS